MGLREKDKETGLFQNSTARLKFRLKSATDPKTAWDIIILTINQYGKTILKIDDKTRMETQADSVSGYYKLEIVLTVEETAKFASDADLQMQFQFGKFTQNPPVPGAGPDEVYASKIMNVDVYEVLNKDKIGGAYVS